MSDIPDLIAGSIAPEFSLPASTGTEIALVDFSSKKNVYLFFVRNLTECVPQPFRPVGTVI